ncbi:hypothetical protein NEOKW01_0712 [Nematocida sp. AWRm80]|nr:hypothetical protein NEOKW01_0712 [Nematocida sp. AWRm80]
MKEINDLLQSAMGIKEELDKISKIENQIESAKEDIKGLKQEEKTILATTSKIDVYQKRLDKIREELRKQQKIERPITSTEDLKEASKILNRKQQTAKILDYFSQLYIDKTVKKTVDTTRLKIDYIAIDKRYNSLVKETRKILPEEIPQIENPIKEGIIRKIFSSLNLLSLETERYIVILTYMKNKKDHMDDNQIIEIVLNDITQEQSTNIPNQPNTINKNTDTSSNTINNSTDPAKSDNHTAIDLINKKSESIKEKNQSDKEINTDSEETIYPEGSSSQIQVNYQKNTEENAKHNGTKSNKNQEQESLERISKLTITQNTKPLDSQLTTATNELSKHPNKNNNNNTILSTQAIAIDISCALSQLAIHEQIILGVKQELLRTLSKLTVQKVQEYNQNIFIGTVYYLEDPDRWMCDNLINQITTGTQPHTSLTPSEKVEVSQKPSKDTHSFTHIIHAAMEMHSILGVSHELWQIIKVSRAAASTKRFQAKKVQETLLEKIKQHFKKIPSYPGPQGILESSLRLADTKLILGILSQPQKDSSLILPAVDETDTFFIDLQDEAFYDLLLYSDYTSLDYNDDSVSYDIKSLIDTFNSIITTLFQSSFLLHIQLILYTNILQSIYSILVSDEIYEKSIEHWIELLKHVLDLFKEHKEMIPSYTSLDQIYTLLMHKDSQREFLAVCSRDQSISLDYINHLVPYIFTDSRAQEGIFNHLEKEHKRD